ncbi:MAG: hypothetical protein ABI120_03290 [Gemmatimonadaceae bacterium]
MPTNRIGMWAAFAVTVTGVAYGAALGIGFAVFGLSKPIVDPLLAIMEVLTMVSALLLLVMMSAVHSYALPEHKPISLVAFGLMLFATGLTCTVHFVELTALRQLGTAGIVWPSVSYAVELLAWNFLLGLSLLFASRVFVHGDHAARVRHGLTWCGALCLFGTIGPAVGNMRLQFIGVFGYAVVLPVVCLMLARLFRAESASNSMASS